MECECNPGVSVPQSKNYVIRCEGVCVLLLLFCFKIYYILAPWSTYVILEFMMLSSTHALRTVCMRHSNTKPLVTQMIIRWMLMRQIMDNSSSS